MDFVLNLFTNTSTCFFTFVPHLFSSSLQTHHFLFIPNNFYNYAARWCYPCTTFLSKNEPQRGMDTNTHMHTHKVSLYTNFNHKHKLMTFCGVWPSFPAHEPLLQCKLKTIWLGVGSQQFIWGLVTHSFCSWIETMWQYQTIISAAFLLSGRMHDWRAVEHVCGRLTSACYVDAHNICAGIFNKLFEFLSLYIDKMHFSLVQWCIWPSSLVHSDTKRKQLRDLRKSWLSTFAYPKTPTLNSCDLLPSLRQHSFPVVPHCQDSRTANSTWLIHFLNHTQRNSWGGSNHTSLQPWSRIQIVDFTAQAFFHLSILCKSHLRSKQSED